MESGYIKSREFHKWKCLSCGKVLDGITGAASDPEDLIPTTGAITICTYCGQIMKIGEDGFVKCSRKEFGAGMAADMQKFVREVLAKRGVELKFT